MMGNQPVHRLRSIARRLANQSDQQSGQQALANIAAQDVTELRDAIRMEVRRSRQEGKSGKPVDVDMVTDQLLFLMLGARSMQAREQDAQPWKLVYSAIDSLLRPSQPLVYRIPYWLSGSGSLLLVTLLVSVWMPGVAPKHQRAEISLPPLATIDEVAPATLSVLEGVYHRMKDGDCQLPQAAMLPMEQRRPFLDFITAGKVDIASVELLKSSLTHVHCLYTKEQLPKP